MSQRCAFIVKLAQEQKSTETNEDKNKLEQTSKFKTIQEENSLNDCHSNIGYDKNCNKNTENTKSRLSSCTINTSSVLVFEQKTQEDCTKNVQNCMQKQNSTYFEPSTSADVSIVGLNRCTLNDSKIRLPCSDTEQMSSDLDSDKEANAREMDFVWDSDCSIKDKDYVPDSSEDDDAYIVIKQKKPKTLMPISHLDDVALEVVVADTRNEKAKRSRWKKSEPSKWKKNITKKQKIEAKEPKLIDCSRCRFRCSNTIPAGKRMALCKNFWTCDFNRRKDFILNYVESCVPERRKCNPKKSPRTDSKKYFLMSDGGKVRVCKQFFTTTLCISKEVIEHAFMNKGDSNLFVGGDKRGKKVPHNKTSVEDIDKVKRHIESFPTMESHYTRKSTKRQYLDCKLSIAKMHAMYKEVCEQDGSMPVSLITYRRIFCKEYNYSFYIPKKDQCQICTQFNNSGLEKNEQLQEDYDNHIARKNDCYMAKVRDKERAMKEKNFVSCTFDLQYVLQIPSSDVSPMYYSRKICTYNLTVYELAPPNNAYCYAWSELNGKRGSIEIGTCLLKYIDHLPDSVSELSLFSDTCSGQNRNQNISAMLLYLVQKNPNLFMIEQKFLESGHSYMEVDSMHSAIERAQKYVAVYTIHDWLTIFRMARTSRSNKKPFNVEELKFKDFYDLEQLSKLLMKNKIKNTNGEKVNWLKIKCFRYLKCKNGILQYRYDHHSEFMEINIFGKGRPLDVRQITLQNAYTKFRPISVQKKQDLLKLCKSGVIPSEFHPYYKLLPVSKAIKEETVPEPTVDDSDVEAEIISE